jgi:hypothetical protein
MRIYFKENKRMENPSALNRKAFLLSIILSVNIVVFLMWVSSLQIKVLFPWNLITALLVVFVVGFVVTHLSTKS